MIDARLRPALYLDRAAAHYAQMVPTHPMEAQEWRDSMQDCRQQTADALYSGAWPALPSTPEEPPVVGEPAANGGLTRSEQRVSTDLVQFWNSLPQAGHTAAMATAVHHCQACLESRILRRAYPDYWASVPGALLADAAAEKARWNLGQGGDGRP